MFWKYFDGGANYLLPFLDKYFHIHFDSSQSRWGFASVFSTIFFSIIAISISLYAVYLAQNGGCVLLAFVIIIGITGILGLAFIGIISLRFLSDPLHSTIEKDVSDIKTATIVNIPTKLDNIDKTLRQIQDNTKAKGKTKSSKDNN